MDNKYLEMSLNWRDTKLFKGIINQGIDSRLEGFTQSKFEWNYDSGRIRLDCKFHYDELTTLIRRLLELETEEAEYWANDIVYFHYGKETI